MFEVDDPVIVEWRAMTVVLIDVIAKKIQENLGLNKEQLNLAQVLEAGTWKVLFLMNYVQCEQIINQIS